MKTVTVIGSTGSVGQTALNVIRRLKYKTAALIAHSNLEKLKAQDDEFKPQYIGVINESLFKEAKNIFGKKLICGKEALTFSCGLPQVDTAVISITGVNGIFPLIEALRHNKRAALSNKESLVAGGELIDKIPTKNKIIPVDSEHSAIFQCLKSARKNELKRLILTASGGAFYTLPYQKLKQITPKDIFHPNWKMGRKITVDSSTMMNKALEIIEARWLFDTKNVDYIIHPDSIIHSMAEFKDGSIIAQLAPPSMELPVQYALTYPRRVPTNLPPISLDKPLNILQKNEELFFAPVLARYVLEKGGLSGTVLNAANEAAVALFEEGKIAFTDITRLVKTCLFMSPASSLSCVDDIIETHNSIIKQVKTDYINLLNLLEKK